MTVFARVVFPLPLDQSFLYAVPEAQQALARPGARVVAPLGPRRQNGFIVEVTAEPPAAGSSSRSSIKVLDDRPFRDERFLEPSPAGSAAEFHSSWGEVLQASLPPSLAARTKVAVVLTEAGREALEAKGMGPEGAPARRGPAARAPGPEPAVPAPADGRQATSTRLVARMERPGLVEVRKDAGPASRRRPRPAVSEAAVQLGLAFPEALKDEGVLAPVERAVAGGRPGAWYLFGSAADAAGGLPDAWCGGPSGPAAGSSTSCSEVAPTGELCGRASGRTTAGRPSSSTAG
ncbi:MAG: hypothetical protein MZU95_07080 [Desulfomicrobium escambiense]|nr:hypothetical protein [Desulfomicrobium escambiense]